MSVRVYEIAKQLGLSSKELILCLKKMDIEVKSHQSSLDDEIAQRVISEISKDKKDSSEKTKTSFKKTDVDAKEKKTTKTKSKIEVKTKTDTAKPKKEKPVVPKIKKEEPAPEVIKEKIVQPEKTGKIDPVEQEEKSTDDKKTIECSFPMLLKNLAEQIDKKPAELIKVLFQQGLMVTINQSITEEAGVALLEELGYNVKIFSLEEDELFLLHNQDEKLEDLEPRAPVVTFMGHVDHGKTSLLDYIRKSKIIEKESGGITQHIGAYEVALARGKVTFLDTPGHQAFTAMRARGAHVTDVVVLVVAADDGIMPQTIEAIDHAKAAGVPLVVAINKIDKPNHNVDRVLQQLSEHGLTPEDWGGDTITVGVSALTGEGVETLLEMLLLEAEMLELKANSKRSASGTVIEAKLSKGRGPVATILVQKGTLSIGDFVVVGTHCGRVRAMIDEQGKNKVNAGPSTPVEILGISSVPDAGEKFFVVEDEKKAKQIIAEKQHKEREKALLPSKKLSLEDLYQQIKDGEIKELKIILKADVHGSAEAIKDSLQTLSTEEVKVDIIHVGIGDINDADVMLASASNAIIIGFHVNSTPQAAAHIKQEKIDVRFYEIIYQISSDLRLAMQGLLEPEEVEVVTGKAKVQQVFKISKVGVIVGCRVLKGKILRSGNARVYRDGEEVFKGKMDSLKRFKDDVKEVAEGFECGIGLVNFSQLEEDDIIECFIIEKKARFL